MFHEGLFDMAAVLHKEGEGGGRGVGSTLWEA